MTGGAGTGKTVVAMHRAKHLASKVFPEKPDRILFTTFTANLAQNIEQMLSTRCPECMDRLEVIHLHAWAVRFLRDHGMTVEIASPDTIEKCWEEAVLEAADLSWDTGFLRQEWEQMVQANGVQTQEEHLRLPRIGRGRTVSRPQRARIWKVFEHYRLALGKHNQQEWLEVIQTARRHLEEKKAKPPYRSKWPSTWSGKLPPLISTPSSMFSVKAYSVRLAEERKSQRPSATAHLTCKMPGLPLSSFSRFSTGHRLDRKVIFLGDFIDRGPKIRQVLEIVRPMIEAGHALAVMGNHELNALAYHTEDPDSPGEHLRRRSPKNEKQHRQTLEQLNAQELRSYLEWFRTLPMWLDLDGLRTVHACWDDRSMAMISEAHKDHGGITTTFLQSACRKGNALFAPVEIVLKGKEGKLPDGVSFQDKDGHLRTAIRTRWYLSPNGHSYRTYALLSDEIACDLRLDEAVLAAAAPYPARFRHWLDQSFRAWPALFPKAFPQGYRLKDHRISKRVDLRLRRVCLKATGQSFSIRPSFLLPYLVGTTEEVQGPLFLRAFGVPFWALARVFGKSALYWYRLEVSLGRNSVAGTTVRRVPIPEHLHNFRPWGSEAVCDNSGWRCPAERLNQHYYHDDWLQNLFVSASLGGYRR